MNSDFIWILFARYAKFYSHLPLDDVFNALIKDLAKAHLLTTDTVGWCIEVYNYHKENQ